MAISRMQHLLAHLKLQICWTDSEKQAIEKGIRDKSGSKFPFSASGKPSASGNKDGFCKVDFDLNNVNGLDSYDRWQVLGHDSRAVVARKFRNHCHENHKSSTPSILP